MFQLLKSRLSPFRHKAFRNFFFVQALSLVGTWSHDLARAYIVIEMMGQAGALGSILLASAIPGLLLMMHGGVLVDRLEVKNLMIATKSILAVVSIALAFVTEFSSIQLWHLFVFAILEGIIVSFDSPAYQTLTIRLVPKEDFQQAIAINSTNFHTARMLGPVIAGVLMAWHGPSLVFLFDGLSFIGLIFILRTLNLREVKRDVKTHSTSWASLREAFQYIAHNKEMKFYSLQLLSTILLVFPLLLVVFRTYIKLKFDLSGDQFGYVFAFPATGAMLGSLIFAAIKPKSPSNALYFGVPLATILMFITPLADTLWLTVFCISLLGFSSYLCFASLTVSLHLQVQEEFRGRIGAFIGIAFLSLGPLASYPIGVLADNIGYENCIYIFASLFGGLSILHKLQADRSSRKYDTSLT